MSGIRGILSVEITLKMSKKLHDVFLMKNRSITHNCAQLKFSRTVDIITMYYRAKSNCPDIFYSQNTVKNFRYLLCTRGFSVI